MAQSGEVSSSTDLVQTAASHDIAQISASTARSMLHQEGLKAMHMVERPLLTRAHKRSRLEFAKAHRDWTMDDWKQVIFSDEAVITARPLHTHKLRWIRPMHGSETDHTHSAKRGSSHHDLGMHLDIRLP
ncbi:hypothetical protein EON65_59370 [archaeon]|nr:MAG: hypothetical protein EON65_59370 [archaeon]